MNIVINGNTGYITGCTDGMMAFVIPEDTNLFIGEGPDEMVMAAYERVERYKRNEEEALAEDKKLWKVYTETWEIFKEMSELMKEKGFSSYQMLATWNKVRGFVLAEIIKRELGIKYDPKLAS